MPGSSRVMATNKYLKVQSNNSKGIGSEMVQKRKEKGHWCACYSRSITMVDTKLATMTLLHSVYIYLYHTLSLFT